MDHTHEHGHDHGHDHAHDHGPGGHHHHHDHSHDHGHGAGEYYLEQLLTIGICGAFGVVAVLMKVWGRLDHMLAPEFHPWVLAGGISLLGFSLVRAVSLWVQVGKKREHNHEHGAECGHDHGACGHDHGNGHEHADDGHSHGNIFWRVVVLAFPILLFVWGLPNAGFSKEWTDRRLGHIEPLADTAEVAAKGGDVLQFDFAELNAAAFDPEKRAGYEGREVRVKGQLQKISDREYRFYKLKMTCCAADMIPLKARIKTKFASQFPDGEWVTAEGTLQFVETADKRQFVPVIRVEKSDGLSKSTPE